MSDDKFLQIKPKKISEEIVEQIRASIFSGKLQPGEKLPPERELAKSMGVSRPPLREALNTLQGQGLVEIQQGNRTYVRPITTRSIYDPLVAFTKESSRNLLQTFELRKHLEIGAVSMAAERSTPQQTMALEKISAQLDEDIKLNRLGAKSDLDFHAEILKIANNQVYTHVLATVIDLLQEEVRVAWGTVFTSQESRQLVLKHHKNILTAIKANNPEKARRFAREHLEFSYGKWEEHYL